MDSADEEMTSLKRRSTLELNSSDENLVRKSSRTHAAASVRVATSKLKSPSKSKTSNASLTKKLTNGSQSGSQLSRKSLSNTVQRTSKTAGSLSYRKSSLKSKVSTTSITAGSLSHGKSSLQLKVSTTSITAGNLSHRKSSLLSKVSRTSSLQKPTSSASLTKRLSQQAMKDSTSKSLWFPRGCFVATLADNGAKFYLCRVQQNVFNSTKEVKVRWFSIAGVRFFPNIYRISYLDKIDPASILMEVQLSQKSRLMYLLPQNQEEEINKMIEIAQNFNAGILTLQDIDDDVEEVVQIDEPPMKKPRIKKTASQKLKDKAIKAAKRKSKGSPKEKKTKDKQPAEKKLKRKLPKKEEELKLNPRPEIKVLDKDPLFETREPMPYISKVGNSKLVYRAINLQDAQMLKKLFKDENRISKLYCKSTEDNLDPFDLLARVPNKEVLAILVEEYFEDKYINRIKNSHDDIVNLERLDTGRYNQKSLGISRILKIQASRGSKEGNNAFTHSDEISSRSHLHMLQSFTEQGLDASTLKAFRTFMTEKKSKSEFWKRLKGNSIQFMLSGYNELAGEFIYKQAHHRRNRALVSLMYELLISTDEDIKNCPPSLVREVPKFFDGICAIHCACVNPNKKYLEKILSVEPNVNMADKKGRKPIHFASCCSSPDNLQLLLKWRANTTDTCSESKVPLHYAILAGRTKNVEILLEHDKKCDPFSNPAFIEYGIGNVNRPTRASMLPLHYAAASGEVEMAKILISNGASVNGRTNVSHNQRSVLQMAAETGNLEMVKLLVKHGAVVEQKDRLGRTALLMACKNGATKVLSYLLHIGADPNRGDSSDNTPLHYAAAYGWYFTVRLLLEVGVDPNAINMWQISPMSIAYMKGHVGIVRTLLNHGNANINQTLMDGSSLLFHACESCLTQDDLFDQIQYMVEEKGARCDIKDNKGNTALFYLSNGRIDDKEKVNIAYEQSIKIANLLLDNGCDIHAVNEDGFNVLMEVLAKMTNIEFAEFLITKDCKISAPADGERTTTILHTINENIIRAQTGLLRLIKILSKPKFITDLRKMAKCYNENGYTPLLHLFSSKISLLWRVTTQEEPENEKHYLDYISFLVKTLNADINAVVKKKVIPSGSILPDDDSDKWYSNPCHAKQNALMLVLTENDNNYKAEQVVYYLVENGSDLMLVDRRGHTPFTLSIKRRLKTMVSYLGKQDGCDVNYEVLLSGSEHRTHPFHIGLSSCTDFQTLETLIEVGCDPNIRSKEKKHRTFLHKALAENGRDDILKIVEKLEGFDFNIRDWKERTALHLAARYNPGALDTNMELEYKIIQKGGKPGLTDRKGRTALHNVFRSKQWRSRNANVDPTQLTQTISKTMTAEEINARDYQGKTALHLAAEIGATISCVYLMSLGDRKADLSIADKDGNTPLALAAFKGNDLCAVSLIQGGASLKDIVIEVGKEEKKRREEKRLALCNSDEEMELDDTDDVTNEERYRLDMAKYFKVEEKVKNISLYKMSLMRKMNGVVFLIGQSNKSESGLTPLDIIKLAFETQHYNIAMDMLCSQLQPGMLLKIDSEGRNLLHLLAASCEYGSLDQQICKIAEFLIKERVPVEKQDKNGLFPIHLAIVFRNPELARLLAEHGTSFDRDPNGKHFGYMGAALWRIYTSEFDNRMWTFFDQLIEKGMDLNRTINFPVNPELATPCAVKRVKDPNLTERNSAIPTTPLIVAMCITKFSNMMASRFLKNGADCNKADGNQITPLMHAVMLNNAEYVKLLLDHDYPNIKKDEKENTQAKKKKPNMSIFRLKPGVVVDSDSESESDSSEDDEEIEKEKENDANELEPIKKTSKLNLDTKDKNGRTALHYIASPNSIGTFDNDEIAFLLVKAGAREFKDKFGMTPYALAIKTGAVNVAAMLKSLGHGKKEFCNTHYVRNFVANDGVAFKDRTKPDFLRDADEYFQTVHHGMEVDNAYVHKVDTSCQVRNGTLVKDEEQDILYDVVMTKVDIFDEKRNRYWSRRNSSSSKYTFYKMQLVKQSSPDLYILFTCWGLVGDTGQFQHTPYSDKDKAVKEFSKIFRSKSGNKWSNVKNFESKPYKYRLLDDSARQTPQKLDTVPIDLESSIKSVLPEHLFDLMKELMDPKQLMESMTRSKTLNLQHLAFGQLRKERLLQGKQLLEEIGKLLDEKEEINEKDCEEEQEKQEQKLKLLNISQKIVDLSNDFFHIIPQKVLEVENCRPIDEHSLSQQSDDVDNLLKYDHVCKMLLGAMNIRNKTIYPADYIYRCINCQMELLSPSDPMTQTILKSIYASGSVNDKIAAIYKLNRDGEEDNMNRLKLENRRFLFHGTDKSRLLSILSRGLMMQYAVHGHSLGKGIYFADDIRKSRSYSNCRGGFVFLCEVALGKSKVLISRECNDLEKEIKDIKGFNSLTYLHDKRDLRNFIKLPSGVGITTEKKDWSYSFNEYNVFDHNQICMRYLIRFEET